MQTGIHFHETAGIEETFGPLLGGLREMVIAMRANPLVFGQLNLVNDFVAAGTFLEKAMRDIALFAALDLDHGFFENSHGFMRVRRSRRKPIACLLRAGPARIRSTSSR